MPMKLSEIKPNPNNPRIIRDANFQKLVKSIEEFPKMMALRPIVVDEAGMVLGGNMRLKALQHLQFKDIPDEWVKRAADLTEDEQRRFIIADNVSGGEWDVEALSEWDKQELEDWGLEIEWPEVVPEATEDNYEIPDTIETDIVLGDLFEIGEHRLLCVDSTDSDSVAKLMNGEKADMVFTDPPYGIEVVNENGKVGGGTKEYPTTKFNKIIGDDTTDTARDFYQTCISLGMVNYIIWGGNYFTDFLTPNRCWLIWYKNHVTERTFANCELAWTNINHNSKTYQITWDGYTKEGESGSKIHPSQKPIKLCFDILFDFTEINNVVYDGFLGSGSIMVASHQLNRKCYGMELDPKYCKVIIDRMQKLDSNLIVKRNGEIMHKQTTI